MRKKKDKSEKQGKSSRSYVRGSKTSGRNEHISTEGVSNQQQLYTVETSNRYELLSNGNNPPLQLPTDPGKNKPGMLKRTECNKKHNLRPNKVHQVISSYIKNDTAKSKRKSEKHMQFNQSRPTTAIGIQFSNVIIYSDSMGRHLSHLVNEQLEKMNIKVTGVCRPGAKYEQIVENMRGEDNKACFIVVAGANDAASGNIGSVFSNLDNLLRQNTDSSFLISAIPHRYDLPFWHHLNGKISEANEYIYEIVSRYNNAHIINLSYLRRYHFTNHGFHLNIKGKSMVARLIIKKLLAIGKSTTSNKSTTIMMTQRPRKSFTTSLHNNCKTTAVPTVPGELTYAEVSRQVEKSVVITNKSRVTSVSESLMVNGACQGGNCLQLNDSNRQVKSKDINVLTKNKNSFLDKSHLLKVLQ